ncbi:MAG: HAD-IIA family hydrolase [Oligoflexales bacterium]
MQQLGSFLEVIDQYDAFFFDAFGVLIHSQGALPGAAEALALLEERQKSWLVVSNGAKFPRQMTAQGYRRRGLPIPDDKVLTSGMMLQNYFEHEGLHGAPTLWVGPECSKVLVESAGAELVGLQDPFEVLVITDGFRDQYLETMGKVISAIYRAVEANRSIRLVLPNPDLLFPAADGEFGVTSGAAASLIEEAIQLRYPGLELTFEKLGKPYGFMFDVAKKMTGARKPLMLGDQLPTDIQGAVTAGIDSVLLGSGLTPQKVLLSGCVPCEGPQPTYSLMSLAQGL